MNEYTGNFDNQRVIDIASSSASFALDRVVRKCTFFRTFYELVHAGLNHSYTPTIHCRVEKRATFADRHETGERAILADAFDAAMESAGVDRRAFRT